RSGEEVGIERDHYIRGLEFINRLGILAEQGLRSGARGVAIHRIPLLPFGIGKLLKHGLYLPDQRRRDHSLREEAQAAAAGSCGLQLVSVNRVMEVAPVAQFVAISRLLRAIRIVQVKQRRLRENIRSAV